MLLNGKSVRGIFVYDDSVKYEIGDLVVIDGRIYQCILESEGENPKTSDKFEIYLGNMISSLDQYYSEDSSYDSLYISSTNLSKILQNEFFGLSDIGVIKEGIRYNSDTNSLEFTDGLSECSIGSGKKVLDELLNSEINNGLIQVSRSLPEIKDLLLLDTEVDNKYDVVFLRQYTYEYQKKIYRVQELIDFVTARSFFRYSTCDEGSYKNPYKFSVSVDDWKGTMTTAEADVQKKLNDIETYYRERINSLNQKLVNLENSYKISTVEFTKEGDSSKYVIDLKDNKKLGVITLYIKEVGSNNIHRLYETLIDIDSVNEGNRQSYYISESIKVDVFKSSSDAVLVINNDLAEIIEINCKSVYK